MHCRVHKPQLCGITQKIKQHNDLLVVHPVWTLSIYASLCTSLPSHPLLTSTYRPTDQTWPTLATCSLLMAGMKTGGLQQRIRGMSALQQRERECSTIHSSCTPGWIPYKPKCNHRHRHSKLGLHVYYFICYIVLQTPENLGSLFAVASFPAGKLHGNKANLFCP